jgi:hypothetical protein
MFCNLLKIRQILELPDLELAEQSLPVPLEGNIFHGSFRDQ